MSICNNGKHECKNWSIWWGVLNMRKSNIFIITSLVMTCVIVGAGATNVFAGAISKERNEINQIDEPCILCKAKNSNEEKGPGCESCNEAVAFAVDFMKDYVKENIKNTYFLWSVDASIIICEGLIIGFRESGYRLDVNVSQLKANIEYWVNKTVGPQKFTVTLFIAKLGAITIGVTGYLLTLCIDDDVRNSELRSRGISSISWIKSRSTLWVILRHLLGFF
jgi:hypothetical protein